MTVSPGARRVSKLGLKTEGKTYLWSFPHLVEVPHSDFGAEAKVVSCDLRDGVPAEVLEEERNR